MFFKINLNFFAIFTVVLGFLFNKVAGVLKTFSENKVVIIKIRGRSLRTSTA